MLVRSKRFSAKALTTNPRQVYIYRPDVPGECLDRPTTVSGEPVLPGFLLDMTEIW